MTSSIHHYTIPSIDLEVASRDDLVTHVEVLHLKLEEILPSDLDIIALCDTFNLTKQEALILSCLSDGHIWTSERLTSAATRWKEGIQPQVTKVLICKLRRKLPKDIEIKNCFGIGYQIINGLDLVQKALGDNLCTP